MSVRTSVFVALIGLNLSGCIGTGHVRSLAPEVELGARSTIGDVTVDVLCADFYGEPESFVAHASQALLSQARSYDWKRLAVGSTVTRTTCRKEDRYIGFPPIVLVPTAPSAETAKSRGVFVHVAGERTLYRLRLNGKSARIEATSLDEAERRFPGQLNGPEPAVLSPEWSQRTQLRSDYYSSTSWSPSNRIAITQLETGPEGAILSVTMEIRLPSNSSLERIGE